MTDVIESKMSPAPAWSERLDAPMWRLAPGGAVLSANSALTLFAGDTPTDLGHLLSPTDLDRVLKAAAAALAKGESRQLVGRLRRSDGVYRRHLMRLQPEATRAKAKGALLVLAHDVEEVAGLDEADIRESAVKALFLANPEPRWIYDLASFSFLEVNDAAIETYGWSRAEFLAMTIREIRSPEENARLAAQSGGGRPPLHNAGSWRHRRKDGGEIEVEITTHPIRFEGREARAVLVRDVTDRRRTERLLEAERQRAVRILNSVSDGFYSLDNDWRFTFVNEAAVAVLRRPASELIGQCIWDVFPEAVQTKFFVEFSRAKLTGEAISLTEYYPPLELWVEINAYPHADGLTAYFRDVTDRWRAERALRERQRLLALSSAELEAKNDELEQANAKIRRMFEQSIDVICMVDRDGRFVDVSPRSVAVWGYAPQEMKGRSYRDFVHPDDLGPTDNQIAHLAQGADAIHFENRYIRKDGAVATIQWSSVWSSEDDLYFCIARDVSEREESEARLRRTQRLEAVGKLTGGVAHDFNNLLTVILGGAEEIEEGLPEASPLRELAGTIRGAAERGADLTGRLLAFARQQPLEPRTVQIDGLLAAVDPILRRTLEENIDLQLVRCGGLWPALIDPGQLENAILNLCLNARDAMSDGGRITIETANVHLDRTYADAEGDDLQPGQYVMIAVADDGCGMTPETSARVLEPFFTTKPAGQGSGLGLSMVYGFVKQSKGHLRIYSEPRHGTTVKLYLPRAHAGVGAEAADVLPSPEIGGTETVFVVEDDDSVRNHVETTLTRLGYRVMVASDGPSALAHLPEMPDFDLLFTDVVMPGGMNGRELAEAVRSQRPHVRVLFTSGYTENAIVHHGRLDSGVHLLSKPYRRKALAAKIRQVLDESQGR